MVKEKIGLSSNSFSAIYSGIFGMQLNDEIKKSPSGIGLIALSDHFISQICVV